MRRYRGLPAHSVARAALYPPESPASGAAGWLALGSALAALLILAALPARAAIGFATSPAATIDTVKPVLTLDPLPEHLLLFGGQRVVFHWTTSDNHPGTAATDFTAVVRNGTTPLATIDYLANYADATWDYQVPDISTGYLNAEVTCRDAFGNTTTARTIDFSVILATSGVPIAGLPNAPVLEGNLPNPCNPGTTVRFSLPVEQEAVLEIYATDGARVHRLAAGGFSAGRHEVFWDGRDDHGRAVASGTYLLRLSAGATVQTRKLALVR